MSKKIKTLKVESLLNEIQTDKQFVENLMRRVERVRLELMSHFDKSVATGANEFLNDEVSACDNWLIETFYGLNGIHATLIEMEVSNG